MTKALVLAHSFHQFKNFVRHFNLNPEEVRFVHGYKGTMEIAFWHWDMPVILLEGYADNRNYSIRLMWYIGHRFNNIGFVSEAEYWEDEHVDIQYYKQYEKETTDENTIV